MRVSGAQDPLREQQVYQKQQHHSSGHQDRRGDGDGNVRGMVSPHDAHDAGYRPRHAETEHGARKEKLVPATAVLLEDGHVGGGAAEIEEEEDCCDGDIEIDGRLAPQCGDVWYIGWTGRSVSLRRSRLGGDVSMVISMVKDWERYVPDVLSRFGPS